MNEETIIDDLNNDNAQGQAVPAFSNADSQNQQTNRLATPPPTVGARKQGVSAGVVAGAAAAGLAVGAAAGYAMGKSANDVGETNDEAVAEVAEEPEVVEEVHDAPKVQVAVVVEPAPKVEVASVVEPVADAGITINGGNVTIVQVSGDQVLAYGDVNVAQPDPIVLEAQPAVTDTATVINGGDVNVLQVGGDQILAGGDVNVAPAEISPLAAERMATGFYDEVGGGSANFSETCINIDNVNIYEEPVTVDDSITFVEDGCIEQSVEVNDVCQFNDMDIDVADGCDVDCFC